MEETVAEATLGHNAELKAKQHLNRQDDDPRLIPGIFNSLRQRCAVVGWSKRNSGTNTSRCGRTCSLSAVPRYIDGSAVP